MHPSRMTPLTTRTGAPRVLIVDDELPIRVLLARMLTGWGYAVHHVGSAVEALAVMALDPADVAVCDVNMPDHDGLWLTAQLRARWPQTAVIMATGRQDADTIQQSRRVGAVGYITKPFVPYRVRDVISQQAARAECQE